MLLKLFIFTKKYNLQLLYNLLETTLHCTNFTKMCKFEPDWTDLTFYKGPPLNISGLGEETWGEIYH